MNNQIKSTLPPKELSLFKRIVKCYEQKQFKNGLKFAKQILGNPKYSEHGETLAMKGLILSCMGKREEAYDHVKKGIKNDVRSSICWHVYGLVQKSDRKYDEAMKCYLLALKQDKENIQILRDLSLLQIQMRNYEGYLETRETLFQLRPSQKASWLGYAVAQHLLENYDEAMKILEEYTKVQQNVSQYNYEHSELLVYHAGIMIESGKYDVALDFLTSNELHIVDKLFYSEILADLYMKKNLKEKAVEIYRDLIDRNPDNETYYHNLLRTNDFTVDQQICLFEELIDKYPRALMPRWVPLKILNGEKFRLYADRYLKKCLRKGVWALFVQLKFLYSDIEKMKILEELYIEYKQNLNNYQSLENSDNGIIEHPTTEIFVNYLLAQHLSHIGKVDAALELVDNQLSHTPTLIDFYTLKGKIYYDAGNSLLASKCLDEAQSLDTADRYVNCVCTRYLVDAGLFKEAEEMASKFTREGMKSIDNLNEMQCMWFLNSMAKSNQKLKKFSDCLQKCHEVNKHFSMMIDDQFDFHSYCLRKTTLRSYVDLLKTEDKLKNHKFYFEAAKVAIEVYLHITDHPVGDEDDVDNLNVDSLSISEAKKLKSKQRKLKKKAETEAMKKQQEQEKRDQLQRNKVQDKEDLENVEEKIDGTKLVKTQTPLDEAIKFLQPLLYLSPKNIETQILAYQVYQKKSKPLLMLKAIKTALSIDGCTDHPNFHMILIKFFMNLKQIRNELNSSVVNNIFDIVLQQLPYSCDDIKQLNNQFADRNSESLLHKIYAWYLNNLIDGKLPNFEEIIQMKEHPYTWQDAETILSNLNELMMENKYSNSNKVLDALKQKFRQIFPFCWSFMSSEEGEANSLKSVVVTPSHFSSINSEENTQQLANGSIELPA